MTLKKNIAILLFLTSLFFSFNVSALTTDTGIGTGDQAPGSLTQISCNGPWTKLICVVKKISDVIETISDISKTITDWVPHFFPFGGPILSSEQACEFKFDLTTWAINPACAFGFCFPPTIPYGPFPITWGLAGRAIEVGPPVPTDGKIIAFPWISKIYQNHTENRAGPWALGLGFTPFPLDEINTSLDAIRIWIPPLPSSFAGIDPQCWNGGWTILPAPYYGACLEDIRFECLASGKTDEQGNDVYKVIRRLGTSPNDVQPEVMDVLRQNYPNFPWP
jgi:hypothetical protein